MTVKKIAISLAACLLAFSLCACTKTVAYKDDVSAAAISESITAKIPVDGGYDFSDADFLTYYFEGNTAIDDFVIAASSASSDVNEYGILHVNDIEKVAEIDELAQVYLSNQRDFLSTFVNTYNAAEMAKLESMQVRVFGNYVVFTILSEADTETVMSLVETMLTK
ncbi:MAG: DUF4358 domain-containing protein [Clostridia bacterium]|jgi:hypothetical protein|nr:DUF4358 domain-containing protein [Clostridia bacterium]